MSQSFRNLIIFGLLAVLISSLSISSHAHRNHNHHMIKVHEVTSQIAVHQQSSTTQTPFGQNILSIIDTISKSVQPDTPSVIKTSKLTTFAFDRNACESLTDDQKKQIADKAESTKTSLTSFKTNVKDNRLLADADNSIHYLDTIKQLTSSTCSSFTKYLLIGPTPYQTNLNTQKQWVLGNITMDALVKDYINRITVNNNVTNCGDATPFWNGFRCITCNDTQPIFNMSSNECTSCPAGKSFDLKAKACIDGSKTWKPNPVAGSNALVPAGSPADTVPNYLNANGTDVCPADRPFVKDNACISCPSDKPLFNVVSNACDACPAGSVFNSTTNQCNQTQKVYKPNPSAGSNALVPAGSPADTLPNYLNANGTDVCPTDKPFVKDNVCISCPADKPLFNVVSKECEACPEGSVFNSTTNQCDQAQKIYKPNPTAEAKALVPAGSPADALPAYMNTNGTDVCPADKPFVKDNTCISCPSDKPYFNIISKACESCPDGATFNTTTNQCDKQYKPNAAAEPNVMVPDGAPADALPNYMNSGK